MPWPEVGYKFRRSCSQDPRSRSSRDSCEANQSSRVVQRQASKSVEEHFSIDIEEREGGQSGLLESNMGGGNEPVVGLLDECAATNG